MNEPRIIPVLDLLNGITVQAVGGRRDEYRPVRSCLTESVDPSVVLRRLHDVSRADVAYIADLDAIMGRELNRCTLAELSRMEPDLMVDAGVRTPSQVEDLLNLGVFRVIVGLESLPGPDVARELTAAFPAESLVLSLDLKSGEPLAEFAPWASLSPLAVLQELAEIGFRNWIVLDLTSVGMSEGVPTEELCRLWRAQRPEDDIITGGGIRTLADLHGLSAAGVNGVLIASALHRGTISEKECHDWRTRGGS